MRMIWMSLSIGALSLSVSGCDNGTQTTLDGGPGDDSGQAEAAGTTSDELGTNAMFDVEWQWVRTVTPVEEIDAKAPERYTLILRPDGKAEMQFDCNRGQGSYSIEGNKLTFSPLIATRMACPDDTQDFIYMDYLQRVTSFFLRDDALFLELPMDSGTLQFQRDGAGTDTTQR
jgi:heat shock protein HslJ